MLTTAFEDGELSTTEKEGLITCIPKGDKAKDNINTQRPIYILNVVYKIGSSCIDNRVQSILPTLTDDDLALFDFQQIQRGQRQTDL